MRLILLHAVPIAQLHFAAVIGDDNNPGVQNSLRGSILGCPHIHPPTTRQLPYLSSWVGEEVEGHATVLCRQGMRGGKAILCIHACRGVWYHHMPRAVFPAHCRL